MLSDWNTHCDILGDHGYGLGADGPAAASAWEESMTLLQDSHIVYRPQSDAARRVTAAAAEKHRQQI